MKKQKSKPFATCKHGEVYLVKSQLGKRWQVKGLNGEIISTCESIRNKKDLIRNMEIAYKTLGAALRKIRKEGKS